MTARDEFKRLRNERRKLQQAAAAAKENGKLDRAPSRPKASVADPGLLTERQMEHVASRTAEIGLNVQQLLGVMDRGNPRRQIVRRLLGMISAAADRASNYIGES